MRGRFCFILLRLTLLGVLGPAHGKSGVLPLDRGGRRGCRITTGGVLVRKDLMRGMVEFKLIVVRGFASVYLSYLFDNDIFND